MTECNSDATICNRLLRHRKAAPADGPPDRPRTRYARRARLRKGRVSRIPQGDAGTAQVRVRVYRGPSRASRLGHPFTWPRLYAHPWVRAREATGMDRMTGRGDDRWTHVSAMTIESQPTTTPSLVIFDCDGVLVDSVPLIERVLRRVLTDCGLRLEPDEEWPFHGVSNTLIMDAVQVRWGLSLPADFLDVVSREAWDVMERELRAVSGVADAVRLIVGSGTATCVASSGSVEAIEPRLRLTGLYHWFEGRLFGAAYLLRPKPWPDVFLLAAETMGVPPSECLVVEDSEPGVQAGQAAGMRVLAFTPESNPLVAGLTRVERFSDMASLPALLGL